MPLFYRLWTRRGLCTKVPADWQRPSPQTRPPLMGVCFPRSRRTPRIVRDSTTSSLGLTESSMAAVRHRASRWHQSYCSALIPTHSDSNHWNITQLLLSYRCEYPLYILNIKHEIWYRANVNRNKWIRYIQLAYLDIKQT